MNQGRWKKHGSGRNRIMATMRHTNYQNARRRRARRGIRGVAAAELAVCLPIVVLLVIATIEACSALFLKQSLTVAAYEGVRTAIEEGATPANIQGACNQILTDRNIQGAKVTLSPANITLLKPGDFIDVTVSAPCDSNSMVPTTFYRGRTLSAKASMMIEN
jgi:Flp pilus assembly protein TadG